MDLSRNVNVGICIAWDTHHTHSKILKPNFGELWICLNHPTIFCVPSYPRANFKKFISIWIVVNRGGRVMRKWIERSRVLDADQWTKRKKLREVMQKIEEVQSDWRLAEWWGGKPYKGAQYEHNAILATDFLSTYSTPKLLHIDQTTIRPSHPHIQFTSTIILILFIFSYLNSSLFIRRRLMP